MKEIQDALIKWTGSKRHLAKEIIKYFPQNINTYYEPFLGGGSIFLTLLNSKINIKKFILSDINNDLIELWKNIYTNPKYVLEEYKKHWLLFNNNFDENSISIIANRKKVFSDLKKEFNKTKDVGIFLFLTRTSINGLIRYNKKGEFNSSCHFTRPGIKPEKLEKIIYYWFEKMNKVEVEFINQSYEKINTFQKNDLIFLDPPYFKSGSMYYGTIDYEKLWNWIENIKCNWKFLTFDGKRNENDYTHDIPNKIIEKHIYLNKKNSSYSNLNKNNEKTLVEESFYILK